MPIKVEDDNGVEIEVYTKEELDAETKRISEEYEGKLSDKEKYVQEKLADFMHGKKLYEEKSGSVEEQIALARKEAQEAKDLVLQKEKEKMDTIKNFLRDQYTGGDEKLNEMFEQEFLLINIDPTNEADLRTKVSKAAKMAGLDSDVRRPNPSIGGGFAPNFNSPTKSTEADVKKFQAEIGIDDLFDK